MIFGTLDLFVITIISLIITRNKPKTQIPILSVILIYLISKFMGII